MKTIKNGIFDENPTFVLMLGLCPTLAVTRTFEGAYIMGLCVLTVLLFTNLIVSIIKKIIPDNVRIPVYILLIATFVTALDLILQKYVPALHETLGIYLPLIAVNCIVLGRALSVASVSSIKKSVFDAIGIGLGFTFSLMTIGLIREVLGSNTITIMDGVSSFTGYKAVYQVLPNTNILPITVFSEPAGAFLTLGLLLALFNYIKDKRSDVK
ncbi:MAG: electron transport complex subunit RsxE [Bacilli bacterium]|nr:electron transport complex subunit RsxE [Bacilli bacterium]MDD4718507.1 electron transport complex subunit RsxE [Bacilli bacterium]